MSSQTAVALAGAVFGLFVALLGRTLSSALWPLAALVLVRGALVAGGIAALAAVLLPASWRERLKARGLFLALGGGACATAVIAATGALSERLPPESGLGPHTLPALYLGALLVPFVLAGIALTTCCGVGGRRRIGLFVAGIGAGALGASILAGSPVAAFPPWISGNAASFSPGEKGLAEISVGRGLRTITTASQGWDLELPPLEGEGMREVLVAGFTDGRTLAGILADPRTRITVLGGDGALVRAALARWPALEQAAAAGRIALIDGADRWGLARLHGGFDLILLGEGWSAAATRSRALSHRRDHRWTVESLRAFLSRLKPGGRLLAQRPGIPRVVATLRKASGLPAAEFARRVAVFGRRGKVGWECWYSPAGLDTVEARRTLVRYRGRTRTRLLYTPFDGPPRTNFYLPLIRGERPRGLAFTTPLDLSPPLDERPFFDHAERLLLSPRLPGMPEELEPLAGFMGLRIVPAADRVLWAILLGGVALAAAVLVSARAGGLRGGDAKATLPRFGATALCRGAAAGLIIEAFAAWSEWLAPTSIAAAAAQAALLVGLGIGWACIARKSSPWQGWPAAAALALLFGAAGYRALPVAIALGRTLGTAAALVAGALVGAALGRALAALTGDGSDSGAGAGAADCGAALAAASLAAVAATLAAPHFGYPLLWVLGAVALLAPALHRPPGADGADGAGAAT